MTSSINKAFYIRPTIEAELEPGLEGPIEVVHALEGVRGGRVVQLERSLGAEGPHRGQAFDESAEVG